MKDCLTDAMGYLRKKEGFKLVHRESYFEAHPKTSRAWVIHHIDGEKLNNALNNLIALPPELHHWLHDQYDLKHLPEREEIERSLAAWIKVQANKLVDQRKLESLRQKDAEMGVDGPHYYGRPKNRTSREARLKMERAMVIARAIPKDQIITFDPEAAMVKKWAQYREHQAEKSRPKEPRKSKRILYKPEKSP